MTAAEMDVNVLMDEWNLQGTSLASPSDFETSEDEDEDEESQPKVTAVHHERV
jgi:hypothetical protein